MNQALPYADYTGKDVEGTAYLLTVWPDGTREVRVRPPGARTWSPPATLALIRTWSNEDPDLDDAGTSGE